MTTNQKRKTPLSQLIASVTESDADFQKAIAMRTVRIRPGDCNPG